MQSGSKVRDTRVREARVPEARVPEGVLPKHIDDIVNEYAKPTYEKLGLATREFRSDFEDGHAMTECLFFITQIVVNDDDNRAIITMSNTADHSDDEIDDSLCDFYSYCAISYNQKDYDYDEDSCMQGGFNEKRLLNEKIVKYGGGKPWKTIYPINK